MEAQGFKMAVRSVYRSKVNCSSRTTSGLLLCCCLWAASLDIPCPHCPYLVASCRAHAGDP